VGRNFQDAVFVKGPIRPQTPISRGIRYSTLWNRLSLCMHVMAFEHSACSTAWGLRPRPLLPQPLSGAAQHVKASRGNWKRVERLRISTTAAVLASFALCPPQVHVPLSRARAAVLTESEATRCRCQTAGSTLNIQQACCHSPRSFEMPQSKRTPYPTNHCAAHHEPRSPRSLAKARSRPSPSSSARAQSNAVDALRRDSHRATSARDSPVK
jgi:hypothetical protein